MRNRAASTGSVMISARRDSSVRDNEDLNRTMLFQVCCFVISFLLGRKLFRSTIEMFVKKIFYLAVLTLLRLPGGLK